MEIDIVENNPITTWNFYLGQLDLEDFDLAKPINQLFSTRYTTEKSNLLFTYLTKLLQSGTSIHCQEIEHIVSNAIYATQMFQSYDKYKITEISSILNEYFKHGHYEVVKQIIKSSVGYETTHIRNQLISSSFKYRNTNVLYDYLKNIADEDTKTNLIMKMINYAPYVCLLDGLLELIHSVFVNDQTLITKLRNHLQCIKMNFNGSCFTK